MRDGGILPRPSTTSSKIADRRHSSVPPKVSGHPASGCRQIQPDSASIKVRGGHIFIAGHEITEDGPASTLCSNKPGLARTLSDLEHDGKITRASHARW